MKKKLEGKKKTNKKQKENQKQNQKQYNRKKTHTNWFYRLHFFGLTRQKGIEQ